MGTANPIWVCSPIVLSLGSHRSVRCPVRIRFEVLILDKLPIAKGLEAIIPLYDAMLKGDLVKINEMGLNFMLNWVIPFMPRKTVLNMSQKFMEKN